MHLCIYTTMHHFIYASMYLCIYAFMYLCIYASLHQCIRVSIYLCICASMYLCIYVSMHLCIYAFMYLCIYASMHLCIYVSRYLCIYLSIYASMYLCIYASMHQCICASIYLCICASMYLCIYASMYLSIYVSMYLCIYAFLWNYASMHLCIYVSMYVCMYLCIYAHLCIYVSMHLCIYVSMYLCIYVSMYLCIYVSMYLCIYVSMYLCIYVSMYLCMYVCMYVCMYIAVQKNEETVWDPNFLWFRRALLLVLQPNLWKTWVHPRPMSLWPVLSDQWEHENGEGPDLDVHLWNCNSRMTKEEWTHPTCVQYIRTHMHKRLLQVLNGGVNNLSVWSEVLRNKMWLQLVTLPSSLYILVRVKNGWWWGIHNKVWSKNISMSKHAGDSILAILKWCIYQLVLGKMTRSWILVRGNGVLRKIPRIFTEYIKEIHFLGHGSMDMLLSGDICRKSGFLELKIGAANVHFIYFWEWIGVRHKRKPLYFMGKTMVSCRCSIPQTNPLILSSLQTIAMPQRRTENGSSKPTGSESQL